MSFLGPKSRPFWAKPKINFNVKTASFGSIQGLPMAVSKTSVLGPSKIQICQKSFKFMNLKLIFLSSFEKRRFTKSLGIYNEIKHFSKRNHHLDHSFLNIIEDSFKKLDMKNLRSASTKRIWKAIFIEKTRRNVFERSGIFVFLQ